MKSELIQCRYLRDNKNRRYVGKIRLLKKDEKVIEFNIDRHKTEVELNDHWNVILLVVIDQEN